MEATSRRIIRWFNLGQQLNHRGALATSPKLRWHFSQRFGTADKAAGLREEDLRVVRQSAEIEKNTLGAATEVTVPAAESFSDFGTNHYLLTSFLRLYVTFSSRNQACKKLCKG